MHASRPAAIVVCALASACAAQSTAFTYQGELSQNGGPADGLFDMRFRLYDALTAGAQAGTTVCVDNVSVVGGRFTATIDLGQQFATQGSRYLEVDVRADTGLSCANTAGFSTLSPRTLVTAAPLATHARSAFALDAPDGSPLSAVYVDNAGNVGVGTTSPQAALHVQAPAGGNGVRIQGTGSGVSNLSYLEFVNVLNARMGYVGDGGGADNNIILASDLGDVAFYTAGNKVLSVNGDGSVRLGSSSGDYRRFIIGGGNSDGFFYGSYPRFGDGVHFGYNYYANSAGTNVVIHPDGGTSRISAGYDRISFATAPAFGGAPVDRAYVDSTGLHVAPTTRWVSVHGSAFVPRYLNTPSFGTQGGLQIIDSFGTGNSGTVGTPGSAGPGEFFAPLDLPDGAAVQSVCVDGRDQHSSSNIVVSVGKVALSTGQVTEVCTTFTSGSTSSIQHPCSVAVNEVVDNSANVYFLQATMNTSGSNIHWLLAARVNYVVTTPLP